MFRTSAFLVTVFSLMISILTSFFLDIKCTSYRPRKHRSESHSSLVSTSMNNRDVPKVAEEGSETGKRRESLCAPESPFRHSPRWDEARRLSTSDRQPSISSPEWSWWEATSKCAKKNAFKNRTPKKTSQHRPFNNMEPSCSEDKSNDEEVDSKVAVLPAGWQSIIMKNGRKVFLCEETNRITDVHPIGTEFVTRDELIQIMRKKILKVPEERDTVILEKGRVLKLKYLRKNNLPRVRKEEMYALLEGNIIEMFEKCKMPYHKENLSLYREQFEEEQYQYLRALDQERNLAGFVMFRFRTFFGKEAALYIREFEVEKKYRWTGLEKHMFGLLETMCAENQLPKIFTYCPIIYENLMEFYFDVGKFRISNAYQQRKGTILLVKDVVPKLINFNNTNNNNY